MAEHAVTWHDSGREQRCAPNPAYPLGIDLDAAGAAASSCKVSLPYPAKRCGYYVVACQHCGLTVAVTTAGRPDDPRSVRLACGEQLLARAAGRAN